MIKFFKDRKLAELLSFSLSALLVIGVFSYLIFSSRKEDESPFLDIQIEVKAAEVKKVRDQYIVPIKIQNHGGRTPSKTVFALSFKGKTSTLDIDYLAKRSSRTMYISLDEDPSKEEIKFKLENYQL